MTDDTSAPDYDPVEDLSDEGIDALWDEAEPVDIEIGIVALWQQWNQGPSEVPTVFGPDRRVNEPVDGPEPRVFAA